MNILIQLEVRYYGEKGEKLKVRCNKITPNLGMLNLQTKTQGSILIHKTSLISVNQHVYCRK